MNQIPVAICIPSKDEIKANTAMSLAGLMTDHAASGKYRFALLNQKGAMIGYQRNELVRRALELPVEYLFLDRLGHDVPDPCSRSPSPSRKGHRGRDLQSPRSPLRHARPYQGSIAERQGRLGRGRFHPRRLDAYASSSL